MRHATRNMGTTTATTILLMGMGMGHGAQAGTIAQWDFDLPSGVSAGDPFVSDTDPIHGLVIEEYVDAVTYAAPAPTGGGSASVNLDGDGFLRVADNDLLSGHADGGTGLTSFEIDLWINPTTVGTTANPTDFMYLYSKVGNNGDGYLLAVNADGGLYFRLDDGGTAASGNSDDNLVQAGVWQHVRAVWDGTTANVYLDGVNVRSFTYTGGITNTVGDMGIGAYLRTSGTYKQQFYGQIDEFTFSGVPVPEPGSLSLLAIGGALALRRSRLG